MRYLQISSHVCITYGTVIFWQSAAPSSPSVFQETGNDSNLQQIVTSASSEEELTDLLIQLQEARSQRAREQKKVAELGQQLTTLLQENSTLEEQLTFWRSKAQDVKNLQDEINTLEEVRCVLSSLKLPTRLDILFIDTNFYSF